MLFFYFLSLLVPSYITYLWISYFTYLSLTLLLNDLSFCAYLLYLPEIGIISAIHENQNTFIIVTPFTYLRYINCYLFYLFINLQRSHTYAALYLPGMHLLYLEFVYFWKDSYFTYFFDFTWYSPFCPAFTYPCDLLTWRSCALLN